MEKEKGLKQAKQSLQNIKGRIRNRSDKIRDKIEEKLEKRKINIALVLTSIRIILAPIVMISLLMGKFKPAIILFVIAGLTDLLDGYFARREKQETFLGYILDPMADKLLINLTVAALVIKFGFPLWGLIIFLIKDIGTISVIIYLLFTNMNKISKPSAFGKATTAIQITSIIIFFLGYRFAFFNNIKIQAIFIACICTLATGIHYLIRYFRQKPKKAEEFHFKILLKLPDYITMLNALCGFIVIFLSLYKIFLISCIFMLMCVVFDYLDGRIAREIGREGNFGKELDSLSDIVSFGVAPTVFGLSLLQESITYLGMIAIFFFIVCGILRLARYNIIEMRGIYYGMPITFNGVIIPLIYFSSYWFGFSLWFLPYVYLGLGILMIGPFKIKK